MADMNGIGAAVTRANTAASSDLRSTGRVLGIVQHSPVRLDGGIGAFVDSVKQRIASSGSSPNPATVSTVDVAAIADLPRVHLAVFSEPMLMNDALERATQFIEDGHWHDDLQHVLNVRMVGGHDLRVADLVKVWAKWTDEHRAPTTSEERQRIQQAKAQLLSILGPASNHAPDVANAIRNLPLGFEVLESFLLPVAQGYPPGALIALRGLAAEKEFFEGYVLPLAKKDPNAVILAVPADGDLEGVLSHEILHGQLFTEPTYQSVVQDFWANTVTESDKTLIRQKLAGLYDETNDFVLANELQAYLLQDGAETYALSDFVPHYAPLLRAALENAGIPPAQLELRSRADDCDAFEN